MVLRWFLATFASSRSSLSAPTLSLFYVGPAARLKARVQSSSGEYQESLGSYKAKVLLWMSLVSGHLNVKQLEFLSISCEAL